MPRARRRRKDQLALPRVKVLPYRGGLRIGARVEVRPQNIDELFYPAVILERNVQTSPRVAFTYTVLYEDGDIETGIKPESIIRYGRTRVYSGDAALVDDGTILVAEVPRRVRLLHFRESAGVYQSGLLMSSTLRDVPDVSVLPFEVNQAMAVGVSMYFGLNHRALPRKLCVIGLGGGALVSCLQYLLPQADIDVVEASQEVVDVARTHFSLSPKINVFCEDGLSFFENRSNSYDLVFVDVSGTTDDFLPPHPFLSRAWLRSLLRNEGSICVMNTLADRKVSPLHISIAAEAFTETFTTSYSMFQDPNYVFYGWKAPSAFASTRIQIECRELLSWTECIPNLKQAIPGVIRDLERGRPLLWRPASDI